MVVRKKQMQISQKKKEKREENLRRIAVASRNLKISTLNKSRFPFAQFGHFLSSINKTSPFVLQDFSWVLQRMTILENYCQAVDPMNLSENRQFDIDQQPQQDEIDLFQAIFYPRCLAPRIPMSSKMETIMTESSISSMWFRLVSYYFEWVSGIVEFSYLSDNDRIRLVVCQICKLLCFNIAYFNYSSKKRGEEDEVLLFGSGFFWDPARPNDPLMDEYCRNMLGVFNKQVLPRCEELKITKEEYTIIKLISFYDCKDIFGLSSDGFQFTRSMCNKYRTILSLLVKFQIKNSAEAEFMTDQEIDQRSLERTRALLTVPFYVEKMGNWDDANLSFMVENNYGGMCGRLQKQIHTEYKKKFK